MTAVITLPSRLDGATCHELMQDLITHWSQDVECDGTALCQISTIGAQCLLSAYRTWQGDAREFRVTLLGDQALACLEDLGIDAHMIGAEPVEDNV